MVRDSERAQKVKNPIHLVCSLTDEESIDSGRRGHLVEN